MSIAALFVDPSGIYSTLPDVDCWGIDMDARKYAGPHPVVAHPPCERWGRFAKGSPLQGGKIPGDDGGCFASALASVRRWGGVLEHPAHSLAWEAHGLKAPTRGGKWDCPVWDCGVTMTEYTCCVEQGHYGHGARKATWLYYVGHGIPPDMICGPSEQRLPAKRLAERGYESARRCGAVANMSRKQRRATPPAFAAALISLARNSIGVTP